MHRSTAFKSCTELAGDIAGGLCTSRELLEFFIARTERHNGRVNAVVVKDYERARRRADEADESLAGGVTWGPLHGVPMTVKENNDVEGLPSTLGFEALTTHRAAAHSCAVQRLVDAGAVIFGKTNLPVGVNDVQTFNPVYGCTANPYDLGRTPGGSSGGSSAALAAGLTAAEFGGDIGGSIRLPAHCCGVWGLKPTWDIIPTRSGAGTSTAVASGDPSGVVKADLVVKGPMARYPEDLTLLLDVLAGPSGSEARGYTLSLPRNPAKALSEYRVALWADDDVAPVDDDVRSSMETVSALLQTAGASVSATDRPAFSSEALFETYLQLLAAAETNGMSGDDFARKVDEAESAPAGSDEGRQARWIAQRHHTWWQAHARRLAMGEMWEDFFTRFDFLITPVACAAAWPHDHSGPNDQPFWKVGDRVIHGRNRDIPYHKQVFWSAIATTCHLPSVAFPVGTTADGLPLGLQVTGPKYSDFDCITFASVLAKAGGKAFAFRPPPDFV
ncbi:Acylamidase [Diplonema papillatum]|nr:Acylamidase [Diplonema papillatum]